MSSRGSVWKQCRRMGSRIPSIYPMATHTPYVHRRQRGMDMASRMVFDHYPHRRQGIVHVPNGSADTIEHSHPRSRVHRPVWHPTCIPHHSSSTTWTIPGYRPRVPLLDIQTQTQGTTVDTRDLHRSNGDIHNSGSLSERPQPIASYLSVSPCWIDCSYSVNEVYPIIIIPVPYPHVLPSLSSSDSSD